VPRPVFAETSADVRVHAQRLERGQQEIRGYQLRGGKGISMVM
jgi:hypothetical protein